MTRDTADNLPPHSLDAERCYLASVMICEDRVAQKRMRQLAEREDFFQPDHAAIFGAVASLIDAGKPVDAITTAAVLRDRGILAEVGGMAHLGEILQGVPSAFHGEEYGRRVQDFSARRKGIDRARRLVERLQAPADEEGADRAIQTAIADLWRLSTRRSRVKTFTMEEMLHRWIEQRSSRTPPALLTGIGTLDQYPGIFGFGKYTIVAGRPSMGKSTAVRWLLGEWSAAGTTCGLVACEEDESKIAGNYLSSESGIENDVVAYKDLGKDDWARIMQATSTLAKRPWFGVDTAFTLNDVSLAVEMLVTEHQCKVVAVDHLHLIRLEQRAENEQREIKEVSRRLKELAKEHGIVLIAAAQLSRPAEKVAVPKPPTLTDLRASGAIEEHADAVLLLHREDYYRPREAPTRQCEIIVAKNRNGRRGTCLLTAELDRQRFSEPASPFDSPRVPYAVPTLDEVPTGGAF